MWTVQLIGVPEPGLSAPDADAVVVGLKSRVTPAGYYGLPLVPYYRPGDTALGNAVRGLVGNHTAVPLADHGPVVAGRNLEAAVHAVEELEETAKLHPLLPGRSPRLPTPGQIGDLERRFPRD